MQLTKLVLITAANFHKFTFINFI